MFVFTYAQTSKKKTEIDLGFAHWEAAGAHVVAPGNSNGPMLDEGVEVDKVRSLSLTHTLSRSLSLSVCLHPPHHLLP